MLKFDSKLRNWNEGSLLSGVRRESLKKRKSRTPEKLFETIPVMDAATVKRMPALRSEQIDCVEKTQVLILELPIVRTLSQDDSI
jgi:hypothetical protein